MRKILRLLLYFHCAHIQIPFLMSVGDMVKPSALFGTTHNGLQYTTTSRCAVNTVANSTVFGANESQAVSEVLAVRR